MLAIGVRVTEIHKFADPAHWLAYFPPLCKEGTNLFAVQNSDADNFSDQTSVPLELGLIGDDPW
jgi:hypothetical protein